MEKIGTVAGKVWKALKDNGESTVTALTKSTEESKDSVLMAIGWLARESKLVTETRGKSVYYSLKAE